MILVMFRKTLDNCRVVQSFSKKGHSYDNTVAECFFKYLKFEVADRRSNRLKNWFYNRFYKFVKNFSPTRGILICTNKIRVYLFFV